MGPGHLPFAGGVAEQPAALMAALDHCRGVEARMRKIDEEARKGR